ncbi:TPA: IS5 family transposase [Candidatus Micrarchaeota archaeon]|nr:IS5 family transposase [Candidatus Micrarchaeota archaeon]
MLPPPKKHPLGCHRPRIPDRKAMEAIIYVSRTGCQWEALDRTDMCKHSSAHRRFTEWAEAGVFEKLWKKGLVKYDALKGIDWRWLSMDGAMTKSPFGGEKSGKNPTDRAKQRTKRSLLTDAGGIPLSIQVAGANRHDVKLSRPTVEGIQIKKPRATKKRKQNLCLDAGYVGDEVKELAKEFGFTLHVRPRGEEAKLIKKTRFKARRWVVERTHSWLNRFRGILIRWTKKARHYMAMLHLVCGIITWRRVVA